MKNAIKTSVFLLGIAAMTGSSAFAAIDIVKLGSWDGAANETYKLLGGGGSPINPASTATTQNYNLNQLIVSEGTGAQGVGQGLWASDLGTAYSSLVLEVAGYRNANTFGIYDPDNISSTLQIFAGADSPSTSKTITFNFNGSGYDITANGNTISVGATFGFYLAPNGSPSTKFYSQNALNSGGNAQIVAWDIMSTKFGYAPYTYTQGKTGWLIGAEDLKYKDGDKDFNDLMLTFTATPVPEPTTIIAGALLLLPFAASTVRLMRQRRAR